MTKPTDIQPVVFVKEGEVFTTSRDVATAFGKRHDNVLRDINNILKQAGPLLNFEEFKINDLTGENTSHFNMDRDGFTLLAMGFTGKRALQWKLKYIEAFNAMEAKLRRHGATAIPGPHPNLFEAYRKLIAKENAGTRAGILHYIKVYVSQYLRDRHEAMYRRDVMMLKRSAAIQRDIAAVHLNVSDLGVDIAALSLQVATLGLQIAALHDGLDSVRAPFGKLS